MNVREYLNKHPSVAVIGVTALIGLGVWYAFFSSKSVATESDQTKAFFSIDDGATWFADAYDKPSGFIKDGKPAYAVNVYERLSGKPFVGFLRKAGQVEKVEKPVAPLAKPSVAAQPLPGAGNSQLLQAVDKEQFLKTSTSAAQTAAPAPASPAGMVDPNSVESFIKRPNEKKWYPLSSPEAKAILAEFGPQAQLNGLQTVTP